MSDPTKSPSYRPCSCGGECYSGSEEEPCWGRVEAADESSTGDGDFIWVHACEGHYAYVAYGYDKTHPYIPEPK